MNAPLLYPGGCTRSKRSGVRAAYLAVLFALELVLSTPLQPLLLVLVLVLLVLADLVGVLGATSARHNPNRCRFRDSCTMQWHVTM